ncbi:MAG: NAD-glutamate dehydrogenase, partial [Chromatiales bacterium]|nr:NAD-glutamate dehydrogenase [Chromatiales bacterium]
MNPALPDRREQTLVRLDELLTERLEQEQARLVKAFAGRYLFAMASDDLLETSLEDHYGSILGLWEWFSQRPAGAILMRAFNPTLDEHGWRSIHTIVDVLLDDRPFLVDSLSMELVRHGLTVHGINHPVMRVQRDPDGRMLGIGEGRAEALLRFEVDHQDGDTAGLLADLRGVLADVDAAVEDWRPMRDRVLAAVEELHHCELPIAAAERDEALDFLRWVANDHFTFIGSRIYDLVADEQGDVLRLVPGSGLGVLRVGEAGHESKGFAHVPAELRDRARLPEILVLTKSTARSSIHRPAHLDYIGVKRFGEHGEVIGEWRFLGLYSSTAYSMRPSDIPLLRVRRQHVLQGSGLEPNSHDGKALQHIIDTFPRDELFQCDEQELLRIATGIMRVEERHRLRIFLRRDPFARFVSVLVYVPRERYDTALRKRMQAILAEGLDGDASEFDVLFSDSVMARVHFIVQTPDGGVAEPDVAAIEERMAEAMLSWDDKLLAALLEQYGEAEGNRLYRRFSGSFPAAYRDDYRPRNAALDAHRLDSLNAGGLALAMQLYRPLESGAERLRFKVFGLDRPMALSDGLPMLERMGLTVIGARPYVINRDDGAECFWVLDFDLSADHGLVVDVAAMRDNFQEAFARVYAGDMENDGFNRLILAAGLDWRQVVLLRAVCKYLLQAGSPFSQSYMEDSLAINAAIARLLVSLFETRFDPRYQGEREAEVDTLVQQVEAALDQVANLDQDRILRRYLHTIRALLRSNYYQRASDGGPKPYLSLKLDPALVPDLPEPRPRYEIFVYSPWVEGVHLRGGKVARGGLRWSDRREDFRTEVLGLMKAQMVKNAVIVPVGAKGGFVPKRLPGGDRAAIQAEGIRCYKTFVSGLLDLTDNLVGGKPVAPADVLRYDEDDPYLVVAADKGTASFSDIANAISADYGFWLGDAFASGGAHGYDHKRMGITARGAWESVKRHFSELGTDIARDTFTVVGIGDMSGDVFGNGMLLSRRIKLVAAFNHLHIFLDPAPDPEAAFEERKRLFEQPGSSWSDYDPAFISKGGGVFARSAKSIPISAEVKALLAIDAARLTPAELIRAILQAPVDLLWNGGI